MYSILLHSLCGPPGCINPGFGPGPRGKGSYRHLCLCTFQFIVSIDCHFSFPLAFSLAFLFPLGIFLSPWHFLFPFEFSLSLRIFSFTLDSFSLSPCPGDFTTVLLCSMFSLATKFATLDYYFILYFNMSFLRSSR